MLGERLKQAVGNSRLTSDEVATGLGVSKSNLYVLYKKDSFDLEYLRKASNLLGVPVSYFLEEESKPSPAKSADKGAFGHAVLQEVREEIRLLREQLLVKDSQIADLQESRRSLQDMLKMVLGKSEGVTLTPLSPEEIEFQTRFYQYRNLVLGDQSWLAKQNYQFPAILR